MRTSFLKPSCFGSYVIDKIHEITLLILNYMLTFFSRKETDVSLILSFKFCLKSKYCEARALGFESDGSKHVKAVLH